MRAILPPLLLLAACAHPRAGADPGPYTTTASPAESLESLRQGVTAIAASHPGAEIAVYYRELARPDSLMYNADVSYHAASTMKVPVMIEMFKRVDLHTLSLDQTVVLENSFVSLADGTAYSLDSKDDSEVSLYARTGGAATLRELNELMIEHSSNFATNTLLKLLDPRTVDATAHALGARDIKVLRGLEDGKAFAKGLNNTTTARDLGVLLTAIERGTAASRASCDAMKAVLLRQEFNSEIPAGVPAGVLVAHKTGWITGTLHDAAIVYPRNRPPYVLVVLTRNIAAEKDAQGLIADISRRVYAFSASR